MEVLTQWVTQIIIFLLLAAIIDLLIPATSMKKYIKLVVGLILILILLKPVFFLFNINIQEALETSLSQLNQENISSDSIENLIEFQKKEIQAPQDAYILEQMAVQLKEVAKDPLFENYHAIITDIEFVFIAESDLAFDNLEEVIVYLRELENGEGAVSLVEDVVINMDDPAVDEGQDIDQIEILLREIWEFDNKKLTIMWEGGAS
ncbi:stage III sporulation protein AF [Virgibacillus sp. C22-A2]|uniref:Stage III sporulation protein AF n=1 Tax=Virgibacillus tibetensis TaxID=3042313 RepID=A0ABU6KAB8_9BACI|nr:stage III sporulation protein AF [Virgibacillus sp. C22-A2]